MNEWMNDDYHIIIIIIIIITITEIPLETASNSSQSTKTSLKVIATNVDSDQTARSRGFIVLCSGRKLLFVSTRNFRKTESIWILQYGCACRLLSTLVGTRRLVCPEHLSTSLIN